MLQDQPGEMLLRGAIALFGVLLIRDGIAGLRGVTLVIPQRSWVEFKGRTGKVAGVMFIILGAGAIWVAWVGL